MHRLILGRPSDLIEKIVTLTLSDPTNSILPPLIDQEIGMYPATNNNPEEVKDFIDQLSGFKQELQAALQRARQVKHDLQDKAMGTRATVDEFKNLVIEMKLADQAIIAAKVKIDSLITQGK